MTEQLTRPQMKSAAAKISEEDMAYFSLGIDKEEFILPSARPDYTSDPKAVALVEAIKAGKDLSGANFSGVNLIGADLSGAKLKGANFSGAVFYKTTAKNCDFSGADFSGAYLEDVDAESADFSGARFHHVFARHLKLDKAKI
ncbi:MAG: pentapeptide repeat-containing protein, partial [Alphaproteobacteria bacterium]